MHGCGHMFLALKPDPLSGVPRLRQEDLTEKQYFSILIGFFLFWFGFMRGLMRKYSLVQIVLVSLLLEYVHMYYIPARYAFTYVQSVLLISASTIGLLSDDKDEYYNLCAIYINLPITVVGYIESMACTSFFSKIGGHFWYDMTIPLSFLAYIYNVYLLEEAKNSKKIKKH